MTEQEPTVIQVLEGGGELELQYLEPDPSKNNDACNEIKDKEIELRITEEERQLILACDFPAKNATFALIALLENSLTIPVTAVENHSKINSLCDQVLEATNQIRGVIKELGKQREEVNSVAEIFNDCNNDFSNWVNLLKAFHKNPSRFKQKLKAPLALRIIRNLNKEEERYTEGKINFNDPPIEDAGEALEILKQISSQNLLVISLKALYREGFTRQEDLRNHPAYIVYRSVTGEDERRAR